jgi:hypothetical protein
MSVQRFVFLPNVLPQSPCAFTIAEAQGLLMVNAAAAKHMKDNGFVGISLRLL